MVMISLTYAARRLRLATAVSQGWSGVLWARPGRPGPERGRLRRPDPQRREGGRLAGAGADQIRVGDQPQDRQDARPRSATLAARPRRRGDRMSAPGKAGAIQPVEVRPK